MMIVKKRIDEIKQQEEEMMKEHGWVVHYVFETEESPMDGLANIHTHGLEQNFGHLDLQFVLPLHPNQIHPILSLIVHTIKEGNEYKEGIMYDEVLEGFPVAFQTFHEKNRKVLRLLLPDANGKFPGEEGCDPMFARQLEEIKEY
jgi:hypothetical protein